MYIVGSSIKLNRERGNLRQSLASSGFVGSAGVVSGSALRRYSAIIGAFLNRSRHYGPRLDIAAEHTYARKRGPGGERGRPSEMYEVNPAA